MPAKARAWTVMAWRGVLRPFAARGESRIGASGRVEPPRRRPDDRRTPRPYGTGPQGEPRPCPGTRKFHLSDATAKLHPSRVARSGAPDRALASQKLRKKTDDTPVASTLMFR
jgi:hypothetical protein